MIVLTGEDIQLDWFGFPLLVQFDEGTISSRVRDDLERVLECLVRLVCLALFDEHFEEVIAVRINLHNSTQLDRFHPRLATVWHDTDGLENMGNSTRPNYRSYDVRTSMPNWLLAAEVAVCDIEVFGIFGVERRANRKNSRLVAESKQKRSCGHVYVQKHWSKQSSGVTFFRKLRISSRCILETKRRFAVTMSQFPS